MELLNQGKMDFVILEGIFDKRHYDSILFKKEHYIGICSKKHPFEGKQVPLEKLFKERLFLREEGSGTRKILVRELAGEGYSVEVFNDRSCISSFDIIKELVSENHGISFVYEAVVKDDTNIGRFECSPLTGTHDFNIVFLKNTNAYSIAEEFLDIR